MTMLDAADAPLRFTLAQLKPQLDAEQWTPDSFIALLAMLAAASWKPPATEAVALDADSFAAKNVGKQGAAFLKLCLDSGFLTQADGGRWRFRDSWLHGYLAARYLIRFLDGEHSERGLMRDRAVARLAAIGSPAIPVLIAAFAVPDDMMGLGAAAALKEIGPDGVPALLDAMSAGNDRVRRWATSALGSKDNANAALTSLMRVIEQEERPLVVAEAVTSLRLSENPEAEPALIAALRHEDPMVRMLAKHALGTFDSPRARRALDDSARGTPASPSVIYSPQDPGLKILGEYENEHPLRVTVSSAPRIFISYAREDADQAHEIRRLLKLSDFDPWMDSADLLAGEAWEQRLTEALRTSDFVVSLLSEHSAGGYQDTELRIASDNAPKTRPAGVPFIVPCLTGRFVTEEALIPAFLDKRDLLKIMDGSWRILHERLCTSARSAGLRVPTLLRSTPRSDLTYAAATEMIVRRDFYDASRNKMGRAASDSLVTFIGGIVTDRATGRQWTRTCGGPLPLMGSASAATMLATANEQKLGGLDDWRLPTLEETMSLIMREKNARHLFISELFSEESYALTCDTCRQGGRTFVWIVSYLSGDCQTVPVEAPVPVRLVRTAWEHLE